MASDQHKRRELLKFLDEKAFNPVLEAKPERYLEEGARKRLANLKRSTANEKKRFHDVYRSARDVRDNYLSDLGSGVGKRKSRELLELQLPDLGQFREEFIQLCDRLQV